MRVRRDEQKKGDARMQGCKGDMKRGREREKEYECEYK
jgi:hypothetical protein